MSAQPPYFIIRAKIHNRWAVRRPGSLLTWCVAAAAKRREGPSCGEINSWVRKGQDVEGHHKKEEVEKELTCRRVDLYHVWSNSRRHSHSRPSLCRCIFWRGLSLLLVLWSLKKHTSQSTIRIMLSFLFFFLVFFGFRNLGAHRWHHRRDLSVI